MTGQLSIDSYEAMPFGKLNMEQLEKENLKEYIGAPKYKSDQLKELI